MLNLGNQIVAIEKRLHFMCRAAHNGDLEAVDRLYQDIMDCLRGMELHVEDVTGVRSERTERELLFELGELF